MKIAVLILIALFLITLGILALAMHKNALCRQTKKDWNYDPSTDESKMTPSGTSPYRTHAVDGNIWWNKQPIQRVEIKSQEGLLLVGNILYAINKTNKLAFVIHGHQCVSGEMGFIAKMYYEMGYNVFMPDQRAHGKSEGKYIGMGWLERRDMLLWLDRIIAMLGAETKIVMHGISMGAATVMMTCGESELPSNVKCAIEDCGYTNAYDSFLYHLQVDDSRLPFKRLIISIASGYNRLVSHYGLKEASAVEPLRRCHVPMLFIHGTHDLVVPFEMMRDLYDACAGDKKMFIVEGAQHGISFFKNTPLYKKTVSEFVENYIGQ
ncbi:MAG: alpha/beta hydrolase [Oscillospiraceae bacterium]